MSFLYSPSTYAALAVVFGVLYAVYRAALPKPIPGIPYHKASARKLFGDVPSLISFTSSEEPGAHSAVDWFRLQGEKLSSPIFQLFFTPFGQPLIVLTDPREIQDILLRRHKEFDRSQFFKDAFSGSIPNHHIVQSTNEKFRSGRRLVADTMTTPFLHGVAAPHLHKHSKYLMEMWRAKARAAKDHAFEVSKDINHMALDSIWEITYGSELRTLPAETEFLESVTHIDMPADKDDAVILPKPEYSLDVKSMEVVTHALDTTVASPFPRLTHWFLRQTPAYRRARAHQTKLVHERLRDAQERMVNRQDNKTKIGSSNDDETMRSVTCATDHLVKREAQMAAKEGRAPVYDSLQATDELLGFLVAGHETTATSVQWIVVFLAAYPEVQAKLRNALYKTAYPSFAAENKIPSVEAMLATSVPYLDAVLEEILRVGTTAIGADRATTREVTVLGHVLPKGIEIQLLAVGAGYIRSNAVNETIPEEVRSATSREHKGQIPAWNDGDVSEFKPERWLKHNDETGEEVFDMHAGPTLQFGGGVRGCFGKKMAYLEMKILVTTMVWTFDLLPVPEKIGGFDSYDALTHKPKNCYVRLRETGKGN